MRPWRFGLSALAGLLLDAELLGYSEARLSELLRKYNEAPPRKLLVS
jgi:hypothetical protein